MSVPFFSYVWHGAAPSVPQDLCLDYQASLSPEHLAVFNELSQAVFGALSEALDAYTTAHPEVSICAALDGARCLVYCLEKQIEEDACDA